MVNYDLLSAATLVSQGNKFGKRSIYSGVSMLPPNFSISHDHNFRLRIVQQNLKPYALKSTINGADYDEACDVLIRNFDWIGSIKSLNNKSIPLSLTGGADSRLMLAIARKSKIANRIKTWTSGNPSHPDVQLAKIVAREAGVEHRVQAAPYKPTPPDTSGTHEMAYFWTLMKKRAWLYSAQQGVFDGTRASRQDHSIDITGLYSETYRRVRSTNANVNISNFEIAFQHLLAFQQPNDPYNILSNQAKIDLRQSIKDFINEQLHYGAQLNEIPELYYATNRIPWWAGSINMVNPSTRLAPLASLRATQIALSQNLRDRSKGRFFVEVMKRLAPDLLELPLVGKTYDPEYISSGEGINIAKVPFVPSGEYTSDNSSPQKIKYKRTALSNYKRQIPWQIAFLRHYPGVLADYLLSDKSCEIFELVDYKRLKETLSIVYRVDNHASIKSILSLVEIAMLVKGDSIPEKTNFNSTVRNFQIYSNIDEFSGIECRNDWSIVVDPKPLNIKREKNTLMIGGKLPTGSARGRVRIDPFHHKSSEIRLIEIRLVDPEEGRIEKIQWSQLLISPNISVSSENKEGIEMSYSGPTPQIIIDMNRIPHTVKDGFEFQIEFERISGNDSINVFFDCGEGFTRSNMLSLNYSD